MMMMMGEQNYCYKLGIGKGERFEPTDEEMVGHYLYRKVMGGGGRNKGIILKQLSPREASRVQEVDVYAEEPWDIWSKLSDTTGGGGGDVYLYTRLQRRTVTEGRVSRRVGKDDGTWHGDDSGSKILMDLVMSVKRKDGSRSSSSCTRVTALKKKFSYWNPKNREEHKRWILHEYSVTSVEGGGGDGVADKSWVVCRLRKNHKDESRDGTDQERQLWFPSQTQTNSLW